MSKPKRFVVVADSHGDMIDPVTEQAVHEFIADFKPSVRIHLGDSLDLRSLRRGASDEEKAQSLENDWDHATEFLRKYYSGGKENFMLLGNHDARLWNVADSTSGVVRDYAQEGIKRFAFLMKQCRVTKTLPYDARLGVLRLGHLKFIHGYAAGIGAGTKHARAFGSCCYGHTHTIEVTAVDSDDGPKEARAIGALCQTDMGYNAHHLGKLRHSNGFAYGFMFDSGDYQIFQARKIDGKFYAATDVKTY